MTKQRILILGATGQAGKFLFKAFSSDERFEAIGTSRMKFMDPKMIQFDPFSDEWKSLGHFDVLINCIGQIRETKAFSFERIHIEITKAIMQNRSLIGNPKILQISALGAGETDGIKFLRTKGISDKILLESENTYVIRPSIICTPGTMLVRKFKMLKKLIVGLRHYLVVPKGFLESQVQPLMIADLVDVVKKISIKADNERIIDVVGPEKLSFGDLLSMAAKTFNHPLKIKTLNKGVVTSLVKYLVSPLFPNLISFEQYQLLFTDNVAQSEVMERILGRKPASTVEFWEKELQ